MKVDVVISIYDDNNFPIYVGDEVIISYRNDGWCSYENERGKVLAIYSNCMVLDGIGELYYMNFEKLKKESV